jgi:Uma2 family endonuclease
LTVGVRHWIGSATLTNLGPTRYRTRMAAATEPDLKTRRWRRAEYDRLVDLGVFVGERLELLDGLLVVQEPQGSPHAAIVGHVARLLGSAFGGGWHARLQAPLALDDDSEPEPDVAVVAGAHRDYLGAHPTTAALVVEVADSSLRLDRRLKAGLYARAGLQEYWIVNLVDGVLEVHREPQPAAGSAYGWVYRSVEVVRPPATVTPLAAPGMPIPVADLLP